MTKDTDLGGEAGTTTGRAENGGAEIVAASTDCPRPPSIDLGVAHARTDLPTALVVHA